MRDGVTFCAISNVYKISWEVRFASTEMDKAGSETKPSFIGPGADIAHRILFFAKQNSLLHVCSDFQAQPFIEEIIPYTISMPRTSPDK